MVSKIVGLVPAAPASYDLDKSKCSRPEFGNGCDAGYRVNEESAVGVMMRVSDQELTDHRPKPIGSNCIFNQFECTFTKANLVLGKRTHTTEPDRGLCWKGM